jgi:hypothetical protein
VERHELGHLLERMSKILFGIPCDYVTSRSCGSLQARWVLRYHGIPYKSWTYTPIIGERSLRRKLNKWDGRVSAPALITPLDGASEWAGVCPHRPACSLLCSCMECSE